jgi:hypothetical protein
MPRRKKTRTISEAGVDALKPRRASQLRKDIAAEAARIMATEGQRNYRLAKQKAAARIGATSRHALPGNREVEAALRAYQDIYGGEDHIRHLESLRHTAIRVMRLMSAYEPRLVGPVLEGTADRHSRVSLHLFSDPPEAVAMHLAERGIMYRQEERRIRWHDGRQRPVPLLVTDVDGIPVEMALLDEIDLRQSPPSPIDGRPQKRANLAEVESLAQGL